MSEEMNKDQEATPHKLMDARKKGQVGKSPELPSFFSLLAMLSVLVATIEGSARFIAYMTAWWMGNAHKLADNQSLLWTYSTYYIADFSGLVLPMVISGIIATIVITILHIGGPIFTFFPLKPDFTKLNPVKGLKKIFSRKSLVDLVRLALKIVSFCSVAYLVWSNKSVHLMTLSHSSAHYFLKNLLNVFIVFVFLMLGVFLLFAIFDLWFSKKEFARQMRMSSRDVKDEHKRHEGDPKVKAQRKKALSELMNKASSLKNVKDSDIVITNPTHVAVALQYKPGEMRMPIVVSKGRGYFAARIKREAKKHAIPVLRKPELARELLKTVTIGNAIQEEQKHRVAATYRWLIKQPNSKMVVS